jgi:hypothetical protein
MFSIYGPGIRRTCQGIRRRELLQVGSLGCLGLSLADLLSTPVLARNPGRTEVNCIFLFLWGGPPQHELWDPKPEAPSNVAGPVKPIETAVSGIRIGSMLPQVARVMRHVVLVRSASHDSDVHGNGAHFNQTGMPKNPAFENPSMGAVVDRFLGPRGAMPAFTTVGPYMVDAPVPNTGQDGGFLGNAHQPFRIQDPLAPIERQPSLSPAPGISVSRLDRREELRGALDRLRGKVETDTTLGYDTAHARAFSLTTSPQARAGFDLEQEPRPMRERYGMDGFGQGCLLARRLIERGCRYVQVNWADHPINNYGFDNHSDNLGRLKVQLPILDRALSALVEDLVQRGMWANTLLVATGEFGRTPQINASAGRDHWPHVYSYLIGGAGISGGRVIGASDAEGAYPATEPISPTMRAASIFSLMGLDTAVQLRTANVLSDARGIPGLVSET